MSRLLTPLMDYKLSSAFSSAVCNQTELIKVFLSVIIMNSSYCRAKERRSQFMINSLGRHTIMTLWHSRVLIVALENAEDSYCRVCFRRSLAIRTVAIIMTLSTICMKKFSTDSYRATDRRTQFMINSCPSRALTVAIIMTLRKSLQQLWLVAPKATVIAFRRY